MGYLGIGQTSYHAARGIYGHGYMKKLICQSYIGEELPKANIVQIPFAGRLQMHRWPGINIPPFNAYYISIAFDWFASHHVDSCDIFHGWSSMCLHSLRKAKKNGARTFIEGSSTHPKIRSELYDYKPNPLQERMIQEINEVDFITTPSQFAKDSYVRYGFPEDRLFLVPYGTDPDKFKPANRKDDVFRVLYTGQVMNRKGVGYLLEAWDALRLENAELIIAGKVWNEMRGLAEQYASKLGNVRILGKVPDLLPYYQNADIFVFPSLEEGSALVTYEALSCGLPVITTPNSGSVVTNGADGFIIPPKDTKSIKEKIQYLHDNPTEVKRMGRNARKAIEQRYTWGDYGNNMCKVYEKVME